MIYLRSYLQSMLSVAPFQSIGSFVDMQELNIEIKLSNSLVLFPTTLVERTNFLQYQILLRFFRFSNTSYILKTWTNIRHPKTGSFRQLGKSNQPSLPLLVQFFFFSMLQSSSLDTLLLNFKTKNLIFDSLCAIKLHEKETVLMNSTLNNTIYFGTRIATISTLIASHLYHICLLYISKQTKFPKIGIRTLATDYAI